MSMYNNAISSDDPQAVEKLQAKLQKCEERQVFMKEVNAYYRKHGTCKGCDEVSDALAQKLDTSMQKAYSWETAPFPSYELSGNSAGIRRLKQRIAGLQQKQEVGFVGWEFDGGKAVTNTELNRLQLFFEERPSDGQRAMLKSNGFKWAPTQNAWQRQLGDNAIYAAGRIDFIKPSDGRTVREHQPKPPKKDTPAR